ENGLTLVDLKLKEGDLMTIAIRPPTNLPEFVRWVAPQVNLGEMTLTTHFYGYVPFKGIELPLGYTTKSDWRDVDQVKIYVDGYEIDGVIPDLAAPASATSGVPAGGRGGGAGPGGGAIEVTKVANKLWRITGGTMVIEFADHMTLFEVDG